MVSLHSVVAAILPRPVKRIAKSSVLRVQSAVVGRFLSFSVHELETQLMNMGLKSGGTVVLHSASNAFGGFKGGIYQLIDCIVDILGPDGNLVMVSMPYDGSTREYLDSGAIFDTRKTPSRMGLISETFRRRKGVLRSANPLHPVLALGSKAEWLVAQHEDRQFSCGEDSPFAKLLSLDAKVLLLDVDLDVLTFTHYVEHVHRDRAPVPLYDKPRPVEFIDLQGHRRTGNFSTYSTQISSYRSYSKLLDAFDVAGRVDRQRLGNTALALFSLTDFFQFANQYFQDGGSLWSRHGERTRIKPTGGGLRHRVASFMKREVRNGHWKRSLKAAARGFIGDEVTALRRRRLPASALAEAKSDAAGLPDQDPGIDKAIAGALSWLCVAQDNSASADGGVARHYSLVSGWSTSYPETTGYIIPTFLASPGISPESDVAIRAKRMLDWLVSIQLSDGGFQGGTIGEEPVRSVTFNTGQILMGLAAGWNFFRDERYLQSMHRAAQWLVDTLDSDGAWRRASSPFTSVPEHTYDTHVAWGLIEASRATGNAAYGDAALANIRWAIRHQRDNGWYGRCCLERATEPLTHTIGYTLRGILEGYLFTKDVELLNSARRTADALLKTIGSDGYIAGRFHSDWRPAVSSVCLTGSVQIAACWFLLHGISGERSYLDNARLANRYVRRTLKFDGPSWMGGGVKGSFPVDGDYGTYEYLNWAAKFFIDSNRMEHALSSQ
jgi:aminoglycoside N3'-acetyltransferase